MTKSIPETLLYVKGYSPIKKFTEWMRDISPIIESYSASLKSEDTEKIIKDILIRDES